MAKIKQDWVGCLFGFSGGWNQRGVQTILHKSLPSALINEITHLKGQLYILQEKGQVVINVRACQHLKIDVSELITLMTTYSSGVRVQGCFITSYGQIFASKATPTPSRIVCRKQLAPLLQELGSLWCLGMLKPKTKQHIWILSFCQASLPVEFPHLSHSLNMLEACSRKLTLAGVLFTLPSFISGSDKWWVC